MENQQIITAPVNGEERQSGLSVEGIQKAADMAKALSKLKPGMSIGFKYREFSNEGEKVRGIFLGGKMLNKVDETTGQVKDLPAVAWMEEDQQIYVNAGANLISQFVSSNVAQFTAVEIEFSGTEKARAGKVKLYTIRILS